jgi:hypothetical protein
VTEGVAEGVGVGEIVTSVGKGEGVEDGVGEGETIVGRNGVAEG